MTGKAPRFWTRGMMIALLIILSISVWAVRNAWREVDPSPQREVCEGLGADRIGLGSGRYLCVSPDGRIVHWHEPRH